MAAKKKNSKTNEATAAQFAAERTRELEAVFGEITEMIDLFVNVSPYVFLEGQEGAPAEYLFKPHGHQPESLNYFSSWFDRWMTVVSPETIELKKAIDESTTRFPDECLTLSHHSTRFAFILGHLMGCRSMGATKPELMEKAAGFIAHNVGWQVWGKYQDAGLAEVAKA